MALSVLFSPNNKEQIRQVYISKHNLYCENQVILLTMTYIEKWHYLVIKKSVCVIKRNNIKP